MALLKVKYPAINFKKPGLSSWTEELCREMETTFQTGQAAWANARIADDAIRYPEYPYVYKYKSIDPAYPEWTQTIFAEKRIWAASLDTFNDPLEAAFVLSADLASPKLAAALSNMAHSNWWGCVSLSSDPVCVQMWAHYAASHSGICIQYRRADSFLLCSNNCHPISYRSTTPSVEALDDSIHHVFWTKSDAWEYEREWRLMYPRANAYLSPGLLVPSGVIFGLRTPREIKKLIKKWAPGIRFGQTVSTKRPYQLQVRWENNRDAK